VGWGGGGGGATVAAANPPSRDPDSAAKRVMLGLADAVVNRSFSEEDNGGKRWNGAWSRYYATRKAVNGPTLQPAVRRYIGDKKDAVPYGCRCVSVICVGGLAPPRGVLECGADGRLVIRITSACRPAVALISRNWRWGRSLQRPSLL